MNLAFEADVPHAIDVIFMEEVVSCLMFIKSMPFAESIVLQ